MSNSIKYYQSANKVLKSLKYGKYLVVDVTSAEPSIYLERPIFLWRWPAWHHA